MVYQFKTTESFPEGDLLQKAAQTNSFQHSSLFRCLHFVKMNAGCFAQGKTTTKWKLVSPEVVPLTSEHVLANCRACAKSSQYSSSCSEVKLRPFLSSCPFESSQAELDFSITQHLLLVYGSRSHTACRSPKHGTGMYGVEGIKLQNKVTHKQNLCL